MRIVTWLGNKDSPRSSRRLDEVVVADIRHNLSARHQLHIELSLELVQCLEDRISHSSVI